MHVAILFAILGLALFVLFVCSVEYGSLDDCIMTGIGSIATATVVFALLVIVFTCTTTDIEKRDTYQVQTSMQGVQFIEYPAENSIDQILTHVNVNKEIGRMFDEGETLDVLTYSPGPYLGFIYFSYIPEIVESEAKDVDRER